MSATSCRGATHVGRVAVPKGSACPEPAGLRGHSPLGVIERSSGFSVATTGHVNVMTHPTSTTSDSVSRLSEELWGHGLLFAGPAVAFVLALVVGR